MDNTPKIALLIDAENASHESVAPALSLLKEIGNITIARAYGNWANSGTHSWLSALSEQAIQQFNYTKSKNVTDFA